MGSLFLISSSKIPNW